MALSWSLAVAAAPGRLTRGSRGTWVSIDGIFSIAIWILCGFFAGMFSIVIWLIKDIIWNSTSLDYFLHYTTALKHELG